MWLHLDLKLRVREIGYRQEDTMGPFQQQTH